MFFLLTHHFLFLCGCKKGVLKKCEVLLHSVFKPKEASYACTSFCFVSTFFLFLEFVYFFLKLVYYFENLLFLFGFFSSWKCFLLLFLKFFPLELISIYFLLILFSLFFFPLFLYFVRYIFKRVMYAQSTIMFILGLFDDSANFPFTAKEAKRDY